LRLVLVRETLMQMKEVEALWPADVREEVIRTSLTADWEIHELHSTSRSSLPVRVRQQVMCQLRLTTLWIEIQTLLQFRWGTYLTALQKLVLMQCSSGNDVGFGDIVNNCVYRFFRAGDCNAALDNAERKINTDMRAAVKNALQNLLNRARDPDGFNLPQLYVTSYGRFWNDGTTQCNNANWAYWTNMFADKTFMTDPLRKRMNKLVDYVNQNISAVVDELADKRLKFIAWDFEPADKARHLFIDEHFCERNDISEPQKGSDARPSLLFAQYNTPLGQFGPEPDQKFKFPVFDNDTETIDLVNEFLENIGNTSLQVNPDYLQLTADDFKLDAGEGDVSTTS
jgi:hypothetical protein